MLSLTLIDSLKLNLDKALQPILHFFARMSAQPRIALRDCVRTLHSCQSSQGLESFVLKRLRSAIFEQLRHDQQTVKVGMSIAGVWMQPSRGKSSGDTVGETLLNALKDLNRCRSLAGIH